MFICYLVHIFLKNLKKKCYSIRMKIFEKKKNDENGFVITNRQKEKINK